MDVYEVGPFTSFDRQLGLRLGSGGRVCNIDIWEADYGSVALGPSNSSELVRISGRLSLDCFELHVR